MSPMLASLTARQAILEVLLRGENYGLGIRAAALELSGGEVDLVPGRLYPALRALEAGGFVVPFRGEVLPSRAGRPRIYYRLTAEGRREASSLRDAIVGFYSSSALAST